MYVLYIVCVDGSVVWVSVMSIHHLSVDFT